MLVFFEKFYNSLVKTDFAIYTFGFYQRNFKLVNIYTVLPNSVNHYILVCYSLLPLDRLRSGTHSWWIWFRHQMKSKAAILRVVKFSITSSCLRYLIKWLALITFEYMVTWPYFPIYLTPRHLICFPIEN